MVKQHVLILGFSKLKYKYNKYYKSLVTKNYILLLRRLLSENSSITLYLSLPDPVIFCSKNYPKIYYVYFCRTFDSFSLSEFSEHLNNTDGHRWAQLLLEKMVRCVKELNEFSIVNVY